MRTINDYVACTPFVTTSVKTVVQSGVAVQQQRMELTRLEVVLPSADLFFLPGASVWVQGEAMKHAYATKVYEAEDGVKFILVPKTELRAWAPPGEDRRPRPPLPTTVPSAGVPRQDSGRR